MFKSRKANVSAENVSAEIVSAEVQMFQQNCKCLSRTANV
jgi:hypothetical protein